MPPNTSGNASSDSVTRQKGQSTHPAAIYVRKYGRLFLREVPLYPLPVDLTELHRQVLRTTLLLEVLGTPFTAKLARAPERILDLTCGTATWVVKCDQFLKARGYSNVSFVGVDVAPLAPDLRKYGVNWHFVKHDIRKKPLPFGEDFDLILVSDTPTVMPSARDIKTNPIISLKQYLRPGGCVEVVETDYAYRCLQSEPPRPPGTDSRDLEQAKKTATYAIGPATSFSKSPNKYISDYNKWVEKVFQERNFTVTPCATMSFGLASEIQGYEEAGSRRVAIPFGNVRWENAMDVSQRIDDRQAQAVGAKSPQNPAAESSKTPVIGGQSSKLSTNQVALRSTALNIAVGLIESMETLLIEASGKNKDEWDRWWGAMMTDLLHKDGVVNGECLEIGVWWARKESVEESNSDSDSSADTSDD